MRIKLDENIPVSTCARLQALGLDVDTVLGEGLLGRPDDDVWSAAQAEARLLVTQDLDFSDARKFLPGSHYGLVLVRLPHPEQWRIADYLVAWFATSDAGTWERCFVVATPHRIRVLRPPEGR